MPMLSSLALGASREVGFFFAYRDRVTGLFCDCHRGDDILVLGLCLCLCCVADRGLPLETLIVVARVTVGAVTDRHSGLYHGENLSSSGHHLGDGTHRSGFLHGGVSGYLVEP
jgi:hypothetical protein